MMVAFCLISALGGIAGVLYAIGELRDGSCRTDEEVRDAAITGMWFSIVANVSLSYLFDLLLR